MTLTPEQRPAIAGGRLEYGIQAQINWTPRERRWSWRVFASAAIDWSGLCDTMDDAILAARDKLIELSMAAGREDILR